MLYIYTSQSPYFLKILAIARNNALLSQKTRNSPIVDTDT